MIHHSRAVAVTELYTNLGIFGIAYLWLQHTPMETHFTKLPMNTSGSGLHLQ